MTVANNYNPIKQEGNGSTTSFSFDFPVITDKEIEVYQNIDGVESLVDSNNYTITLNTNGGTVNFNTAPAKGVVIAIVRVVDLTQEIPFLTSSGFPADRVEDCFDKLTMIAQQQQQVLDRCVKVVVTGNQTPEELLDEVYDKLDSATEIAEEAVDAANAATQAVESAEKTLREVTTYVDTSKSEINTLVTDATNSINTTVGEATTNLDNTISQAVNDVKAEAIAAAEGAIQDAANTAIQIVTEHANTVIIPPLQEYVDNARESATSAEESSLSASASALSASQSASNALASETNAKNSASEAALHNLKNKITNCITEIPQDIKLEIESTTDQYPELILKAESKVYVSTNGTFSPITIQSDIKGGGDLWTGGHNRELFVLYVPSTNRLQTLPVQYCFSQNTAPTSFLVDLYAGWFDTSTNTVKYTIDGGSNWIICSLPLCLGRPGVEYVGWNGYVDQVFNGFGYIGSTVFALPGVKGLIPNGRNEDGSLKNIEFTTQSVLTQTRGLSGENKPLVLKGNDFSNYGVADYNKELNLNISSIGTDVARAIVGTWSATNGVITSFIPKLPFRAVDANDIVDSAYASNNSTKIATTAWVNNKHQVVTALPSSPTAGVFYFVKE